MNSNTAFALIVSIGLLCFTALVYTGHYWGAAFILLALFSVRVRDAKEEKDGETPQD